MEEEGVRSLRPMAEWDRIECPPPQPDNDEAAHYEFDPTSVTATQNHVVVVNALVAQTTASASGISVSGACVTTAEADLFPPQHREESVSIAAVRDAGSSAVSVDRTDHPFAHQHNENDNKNSDNVESAVSPPASVSSLYFSPTIAKAPAQPPRLGKSAEEGPQPHAPVSAPLPSTAASSSRQEPPARRTPPPRYHHSFRYPVSASPPSFTGADNTGGRNGSSRSSNPSDVRPTQWPVTAACGSADYSTVPRMGFPASAQPEVCAAEQRAWPGLEMDEEARERRWHDLCRGVPLLASAAPSTVEALRRLARRSRQGGIPRSLREVMWLTLTGMAAKVDENEYFCATLLRRSGYVTGTYGTAIAVDLERTFPGHPYFSEKDVGMYKLHNLLHALCWRNPLLNYCQSFNRIAGYLLLVFDDEERAFWMLTHILETLLPNDYFGDSLVGVRVDQAVFEHLVATRLPAVATAVSRLPNFQVSAVLPSWVMSLYVNIFPIETTLRVWDYILTEADNPTCKTAAHLEVALAVLKLHEPALLACEDAGDAMVALREGTERLYDADGLLSTARSFVLDPAELHSLRRQVKPLVAQEIREREQLREAMREQRVAQEMRRHQQGQQQLKHQQQNVEPPARPPQQTVAEEEMKEMAVLSIHKLPFQVVIDKLHLQTMARGRKPVGQSATVTNTSARGGRRPASSASDTKDSSEAWVSGSKRRRGSTVPEGAEKEGEADVTLIYRRPSQRRTGGGGGAVVSAACTSATATRAAATAATPSATSIRGAGPRLSQTTATAATTAGGITIGARVGRDKGSLSSSSSSSLSSSAVGRAAQDPLQLWRRCVGQRNLVHALENCGLAPTPPEEEEEEEEHGGEENANGNSGLRREAAHGKVVAMPRESQGAALVRALLTLDQDRIRAAIQSLIDLKALSLYLAPGEAAGLVPVADPTAATSAIGGKKKDSDRSPVSTPTVAVGGGWWVEQRHFTAVTALARLCDVAVATVLPPLVPADAMALADCPHTFSPLVGGKALVLVPHPVVMLSAQERLRGLTRLWQLRFTHGLLAPALQACRSLQEVNQFFFSPSSLSSPADTFVAFPASASARHRAEELVLAELTGKASRRCRLDGEAWGPMAVLAPLKVRAGAYVVEHVGRAQALKELLAEEADLYGLPPFLRSIRKSAAFPSIGAGGGGLSALLTGQTATVASMQEGVGLRGAARGLDEAPEHLFFPSLRALDAARFAVPDAMQAPLVTEELIGLTLKHCAFGLVIGEADQILFLLKEWNEHRVEVALAKQQDAALAVKGVKSDDAEEEAEEGGVKREREEEGDSHHHVKAPHHQQQQRRARRRDPMAPFARETAVRARALRRGKPIKDEENDPTNNDSDHTKKNSSPDGAADWRRLCHVHWMCPNRWAAAETGVSYFGLVYGVVLCSELMSALDGATPSAPLDADNQAASPTASVGTQGSMESGSDGAFHEVVYYPSAVVELSR